MDTKVFAPSVKGLFILDEDGNRIYAKYWTGEPERLFRIWVMIEARTFVMVDAFILDDAIFFWIHILCMYALSICLIWISIHDSLAQVSARPPVTPKLRRSLKSAPAKKPCKFNDPSLIPVAPIHTDTHRYTSIRAHR